MTKPTDIPANISMVAMKNNSSTTASRPDWLLYVIPSIAFVVGLWLFSKIYRTQRRREQAYLQVAALKKVMSTTSSGHTYTSQHPTGERDKDVNTLQDSIKTSGNLKKQEAQSYENVTAVIYSNENKVNYCFRRDDDYITPDADTDEVTDTDKSIYLQPLQNFIDTDGESYENMEGSVYARPRQPTKRTALSVEDDDYINPDGENKHNLEHTDTESYENMAGLSCPNTNTQTVEEGCYECMDRKQIPS